MKKLFVTLFLTLIFTIAYFGMAQAQTKPVAPAAVTGGGSELANKHKSKVALQKIREARTGKKNPETSPAHAPVKVDVEADKENAKGSSKPATPEKVAEATKVDASKTTASTSDNKNKVWVKGTATSKDVKDIKFEVKKNDKGEFIASASDAGCTTGECANHEVKLDTTQLKANGEIPQLKAIALKAMQQFYGDVKDTTAKEEEKELTAEETRLKNNIDTCQYNSAGKYFKDDEAQADCIKSKLDELIDNPKNESKIAKLQKVLLDLYMKDLTTGKTAEDSPFIQLVVGSISDISQKFKTNGRITGAEKRLLDRMTDVQAKGHLTVLENMNASIQTQFTLGQAQISNGNPAAADTIFQHLVSVRAKYYTLANSTIGTIKNTPHSDKEADIKSGLTDLDITLAKFKSNIATAIVNNKGNTKTTLVSKSKFGFSLDNNTAVDSAGNSNDAALNTMADFDRLYAKSIRGLTNNDFLGTSPTLRPDASIGTGATALTQNNGNIINGANVNQNTGLTPGLGSPSARFAGNRRQ